MKKVSIFVCLTILSFCSSGQNFDSLFNIANKESFKNNDDHLITERYFYFKKLDSAARNSYELKQYAKGDSFFAESLGYRKKVLGIDDPDYGNYLSQVGYFYEYQRDTIKAEKIYLELLEIRRKFVGIDRLEYLESLNQLAEFYTKNNRIQEANFYYNLVALHINKSIYNRRRLMTEREWLDFLSYTFLYQSLCDYRSFMYKYPIISDSLNIVAYNNELLLKNGYLHNILYLKKSILESKDSNLISNYNEYYSLKRNMENSYKTSNLEKQLAIYSESFAKMQNSLKANYFNVKNHLTSDEISIELINFHVNVFFNYNIKNPSMYYLDYEWANSNLNAALITKNNLNSPKFLPLCFDKNIDSIFKAVKHISDSSYYSMLYNPRAKLLFDYIIKPYINSLDGIKTIYIVPVSYLHYINIPAIPVDSNQTFGEKYDVHILGSSADILDYKPTYINPTTVNTSIVFGGVDYNKASRDTDLQRKNNDLEIGFEQVSEIASRSGVTSFSYLPGTILEANNIRQLNISNGIPTIIFSGNNATESNFKSLSGKKEPYILHIATHGYFFPDPELWRYEYAQRAVIKKNNVFKWSEDPLLRSGLIFAGANRTWANLNYVSDSTEDGILTSYEISNLDLSNCQLVVLSACETGLGDIKGSEGVFGLQRAFKMAGVKNIIMSLWKVPDAQTSELMTSFYTYCFAGKSVHDALQAAQTDMKKKYPPYYWAGFMLLE